ncbi:MAG TPA: TfoX/Sxy family protein [Thermoanaerobaculia bacterium]|nr:TfoX/Sxy family protein [Thermoanaerobaculia bacterium]
MKWKKSSPALVELFSSVVPGAPAEQRKMFGYPAAFVNGNLFMALHQENFILRLPREQMLKIKGAKPFEPMPGRKMKEYIVAPKALIKDESALREWVGKSLEYVLSLPKKAKKKATKKNAAKSTRRRRG